MGRIVQLGDTGRHFDIETADTPYDIGVMDADDLTSAACSER
jgi:hypothetical protein